MAFDIPSSCTLPTAERPLRAAEFEALFPNALDVRRDDPRHVRLSFAGGDTLAATVRDLAARETACCSFFEFSVSTGTDRVLLDVTVPTSRVDVLDGIVALTAQGSR